MEREDIKMLVKKWWDIYNDSTLDYKPTLPSMGLEKQPSLLAAALQEAGTIKYVTAPSAA
jgi:inositol 3-alpha-galactosyltransferase